MSRHKVHMPPDWTREKRQRFLRWLNDELEADEGRPETVIPVKEGKEQQ